MKKVEELKDFIKKLSQGNNPITNETLPEESFINSSFCIRKFYDIYEILTYYEKENHHVKISILKIDRSKYITSSKITLNRFLSKLNKEYITYDNKEITFNYILNLLIDKGFFWVSDFRPELTYYGDLFGFDDLSGKIVCNRRAQNLIVDLLSGYEIDFE